MTLPLGLGRHRFFDPKFCLPAVAADCLSRKLGAGGVTYLLVVRRGDRLGFVDLFRPLLLGSLRRHPGRHRSGLQRSAREHADLPTAIALETEQPFALTHAQKLHHRREAPLALVEVRIHSANELLELADVHRPSRRLRRAVEHVSRRFDDLLNLLGIHGRRRRHARALVAPAGPRAAPDP